jgi:23S rRNA (adenine2030-N6)-methyltransferase
MLSYQHAYHAGNLADVHKHALLAWMLDYLKQKPKPLSYIETHAGRGLYDLTAPEAAKTGEATTGIGALRDCFAADHPYARVLAEVARRYGPAAYAGSPLIAALSLRPGDRMHMAELHPQEIAALQDVMAPYGATCYRQDGFAMVRAVTPPTPRRGLMLVDPSYEVKADYAAIPPFVAQVHRKWNVGVLMLWYPILTTNAHAPMLAALEAANHPGALLHEIRFHPARPGHGMIGSGILVVNAPFGMEDEARRLSVLFG